MVEIADIAALPSLEDFGFSGGRESFRAFCKRAFRDTHPRYLRNEKDQLVVFRHADLQAFGAAPEIGNVPIGKLYPDARADGSEGGAAPGSAIKEVIGNQIFTYNAPLHGPARRILTDWLSPKQVALMEGVARETARKVIDAALTRRNIDFVTEIAEELTVGFWSKLLHLTDAERIAIGRCAAEMTRLFYANRTAEDLRVLDQAFAQYARVLGAAADRGLADGDPALTVMAGKLSQLSFDEDPFEAGTVPGSLGALLAGNLVDGFHTAALATANTFHTLLNNQDAYEAVRRLPELLPRAIAESLRLEPPVLLLPRYVLRDFHHDGMIFQKGTIIEMLWAAGNHDPAVFSNPDQFDLHRPHTGLTTFGKGVHICPGRYVGVMLVRILIEEFAAKGVRLQAMGAADWYPSHKMAQLRAMPVSVVAHPS
jgi:cytochrome P450